MLITFIRSIILYIIVLFVMRLMGKREIGQLQPFELAISIMIADLASIPMSDIGIPIFTGIVPILGLLVMHFIISELNMQSLVLRKIISGKPTVLIKNGVIDEKAIKKERITISELEGRLREKDIFNFEDVEYAVLETSGQITAVEKIGKQKVTKEDINISQEEQEIFYDLIIDGKISLTNLEKLGKDMEWIDRYLKNIKIKKENILIMTMNKKGHIFYQEKSGD